MRPVSGFVGYRFALYMIALATVALVFIWGAWDVDTTELLTYLKSSLRLVVVMMLFAVIGGTIWRLIKRSGQKTDRHNK